MGYCINCDNRHGCKSKTPPCITAMRESSVKGICGKGYLIDTNALELCKGCEFFHSCWKESEWETKQKNAMKS